MADRRPAGVLRHDALGLAAMAEPKHLADAAQPAVGFEQLLPVGVVAGHAGRELAAVLDVQQHPRNQPRDFVRPLRRAERTRLAARQMIDGGHAALVVQVGHEGGETGGGRGDP